VAAEGWIPISSSISLKQVWTIDLSTSSLTIPPGKQTSSACARKFLLLFSNSIHGFPSTLHSGSTTPALFECAVPTLRGILFKPFRNSSMLSWANPPLLKSSTFPLLCRLWLINLGS
jgi:hypothetical protein